MGQALQLSPIRGSGRRIQAGTRGAGSGEEGRRSTVVARGRGTGRQSREADHDAQVVMVATKHCQGLIESMRRQVTIAESERGVAEVAERPRGARVVADLTSERQALRT